MKIINALKRKTVKHRNEYRNCHENIILYNFVGYSNHAKT